MKAFQKALQGAAKTGERRLWEDRCRLIKSQPRRLGPIRLSPGVAPWHVGVFLLTNTVTSTLIGYVTVVQPYMLTQVLHIAVNQQGRLTGLLNAAHYGAVALFIVLAGGLADTSGASLW